MIARRPKIKLLERAKTTLRDTKEIIREINTEIKESKIILREIKKLKTKNYSLEYRMVDGVCYFYDLKRTNKAGTYLELINLFKDLKTKAINNSCSQISTRTWIFLIHPKLKERLGFETVNKDLEKSFKTAFDELLIKKIVKIDNNLNAWAITKDGKKTRLYFSNVETPEYVLPLWH